MDFNYAVHLLSLASLICCFELLITHCRVLKFGRQALLSRGEDPIRPKCWMGRDKRRVGSPGGPGLTTNGTLCSVANCLVKVRALPLQQSRAGVHLDAHPL